MPFPRRIHHVQALAVLALSLPAQAGSGPFEGYWKRIGEADYDGYLKVAADSGYRCIMDGKSSHRFKIEADSITTPMNGMDAIVFISPDVLRISGVEKGDPYHSDWMRMDAHGYPKACADEEAEWYGPTVLRDRAAETDRRAPAGPAARSPVFGHREGFLDALGRSRRVP